MNSEKAQARLVFETVRLLRAHMAKCPQCQGTGTYPAALGTTASCYTCQDSAALLRELGERYV